MIFGYGNDADSDSKPVFIITVTDEILIFISLNKSKVPEIKLQGRKHRRPERLILTVAQCYAIYDVAPQVKAISTLNFNSNPRDWYENFTSPSTLQIPIDRKKTLTLTIYTLKAIVRIETLRNRKLKRHQAFPFEPSEWQAFLDVKDQLYEAIRQIKTATENVTRSKNVPQYSWLALNLDGTAVHKRGHTWKFVKHEALLEGQRASTDNSQLYLQYREIKRPTLALLYNTACAYLIRSALKAETVHPDTIPSNNKMNDKQQYFTDSSGHLPDWTSMAQKRYSFHHRNLNITHLATLYHEMTSILEIPTPPGLLNPVLCEDTVKSMVYSQNSPQPELEALCDYIHRSHA